MKFHATFLMMALMAMVADVTSKTYSTANDFPLPSDNTTLADPDRMLNDSDRQYLSEKILASCHNLVIHTQHDDSDDNEAEQAIPVEIAVAIVDRLKIKSGQTDEDVNTAVGKFATELHDRWGIGQQTKKGGSGVLVLLDISDRAVFISRGSALENILTIDRLERIISEMASPLIQAKYDVGLLQAVESIVHYLQTVEPNGTEDSANIFPFIVLCLWIFFAVREWKMTRSRREYARSRSQLTEVDRARAETLLRQIQPQTNCSICLEKFQTDTIGSDGQPIKLLRCGHIFDESCWSEWVSSGRGALTKCPVCRMDVSNVNNAVEETVEHEQGNRMNISITSRARSDSFNEHGTGQAMRLHPLEGNFRVARIPMMNPHFLASEQGPLHRSQVYSGQMSEENSFRVSYPVRVQCCSNQRDSFSDFGGGLSSGGAGGRF
ncbi:TPM domain containing protein [Nitzschia inconspicua]|uniref:TPM domain containing protein n=1 Tax=Nitzschia inconspicua TaxID=303405 RepID=A0A9K3QA75_9STRA|nr:TPM domain containing protein [Nitzschia inconspicua]